MICSNPTQSQLLISNVWSCYCLQRGTQKSLILYYAVYLILISIYCKIWLIYSQFWWKSEILLFNSMWFAFLELTQADLQVISDHPGINFWRSSLYESGLFFTHLSESSFFENFSEFFWKRSSKFLILIQIWPFTSSEIFRNKER